MAQQHVLEVQKKHLGTTIVQDQVFMSGRASQHLVSLFNLLSLLTVDTEKSPCCKKKAHVQRRNKGKTGEHWWRRRAFQHNRLQISLTRRAALAKGSNQQKALAGWEPTNQPTNNGCTDGMSNAVQDSLVS